MSYRASTSMIVVVMGVAGAGKTTIGTLLAGALGASFVDADAFHSDTSRAKMARGEPLDDADRAPWLAAMAAAIDTWLRDDRDVVLACSALKRAYRRQLFRDPSRMRLVHLTGSPEVLRERLDRRTGHFATSALLASQFDALEMPQPGELAEDVITVDVAPPPEAIVETIVRRLGTAAR